MLNILTIIYAVIACLPLALAAGAISPPTNSDAIGQVAFSEQSVFCNGPDCRSRAHTELITATSASIHGNEDSGGDKKNGEADSDKKNEKDEKEEDPGQIRLWDSVLLG